jgi:hypothetical protein
MKKREPLPKGAPEMLLAISPPGFIRDRLVPLVLAWHERETRERSKVSPEIVALMTEIFLDQIEITSTSERALLNPRIQEMLNTLYVYPESKLMELIVRSDYLGAFAKWVVTFLHPLRY